MRGIKNGIQMLTSKTNTVLQMNNIPILKGAGKKRTNPSYLWKTVYSEGTAERTAHEWCNFISKNT